MFFVKKECLDIGKVEVTDLERTMCDLVRNRNSFEIQGFNAALKTYARKKEKNLTRLFEYAKLLRVEKLMRSYMEVLL